MSNLIASLLSPTPPTNQISPHAPLILITDSILQPGLLLLREFISTSLQRNDHVIALALEQPPSKLLPAGYPRDKVDLVDAVSGCPYASTSTLAPGLVNLHEEGGLAAMEKLVLDAVGRRKAGDRVLVVIDSVDALAEFGVHAVVSLLRRLLKLLESIPGSRVVALHHNAYPSSVAGPSPALLSTLLSPHTSPSTIHLKLHPSPLLELLSSEYGLSIPLLASLPLDIRLYSFLASFAARAWGNPFFRPSTSQTLDERIAVNMLAAKEGSGCVLEWSCRGVNTGVALKRGEVKKIVGRGLEGLRRTRTGVQVVGLKDVLSAVKMRSAAIPTSIDLAKATPVKVAEPLLPFNLSLTDAQRSAREEVVLPYLPKEDSVGGGVHYDPDEADDFDDDDPDEDLEV